MAGKNEMNNHTAFEKIRLPEKYILTISDRSGTGKYATAESLAHIFGILPEE